MVNHSAAGALGPHRVTHVTGGGGQETGTKVGVFSTNVMLHGNHTCLYVKGRSDRRLGGQRESGHPST